MVLSVRARIHSLTKTLGGLMPVRRVATARLPTEYGEFDIHVYKSVLAAIPTSRSFEARSAAARTCSPASTPRV